MGGNPNSKRGRVRTCFQTKGEEAAISLGASLGVAASRIRRWVKKWTPRATTDMSIAPVIKPTKKGLVYLKSMPDCFGKVTKKGKTESEVTWLNGNVTTVQNEWIQPVETGG